MEWKRTWPERERDRGHIEDEEDQDRMRPRQQHHDKLGKMRRRVSGNPKPIVCIAKRPSRGE
jgi:hypothetical protein